MQCWTQRGRGRVGGTADELARDTWPSRRRSRRIRRARTRTSTTSRFGLHNKTSKRIAAFLGLVVSMKSADPQAAGECSAIFFRQRWGSSLPGAPLRRRMNYSFLKINNSSAIKSILKIILQKIIGELSNAYLLANLASIQPRTSPSKLDT